jgi:hypothetical protein
MHGNFASDTAVTSWSANRLDVFGVGLDFAIYHKAWNGISWSSDWDNLGGGFTSPPAVISWGFEKLDVFGIGTDSAMYHLALQGTWGQQWENLGWGPFKTAPVAVSWGSGRLDVFAMWEDNTVWHKGGDNGNWMNGNRESSQGTHRILSLRALLLVCRHPTYQQRSK